MKTPFKSSVLATFSTSFDDGVTREVEVDTISQTVVSNGMTVTTRTKRTSESVLTELTPEGAILALTSLLLPAETR